MSEASISSSPSISGNTINKRRLKRRSKRSKIDLSAQHDSDQEDKADFFHILLRNLYNDSEYEPALENKSKSLSENPAILSNFKPFEVERTLAAADHIFVNKQPSQNRAEYFTETQGFVTCINLSQTNNEPETRKNSQNDSFVITDTELISCCHEAENILHNESNERDSTLHELTPKKKDGMVLVNSILEDFCQSPLSKDQIITNSSWQYTPEFRLRRLPVKSYSRKHVKNTQVNLTQRFAEAESRLSSEYDENMSNCSSLSIQEDDTLCENQNNPSIAATLNNTERLCENLLNLTEFFTQNELKQSLESVQQSKNLINLSEDFTQNDVKLGFEDQQSREALHYSEESSDIVSDLHNISDLLCNILSLRSKYTNELHDDSCNSSDDFIGFANASDLNLCDYRHSDDLTVKEDNNFFNDWNDDNCHLIFACINTENVLQQNDNYIPSNKRSNIAVDDVSSTGTTENQTFVVPNLPSLNTALDNLKSFKTASSKPIQVSAEASIIAAKVLPNLPTIPDFTKKDHLLNCDNKPLHNNENIFENPEDYEWNDDCDLFLNFQTPISSKESIAANTQQELPILPEVSQHKQDAHSAATSAALGFTTAAGKNVRITSKGQATVQRLLNEFAGEINNNKSCEEELKEIKSKVYAKNHNLKTESSSLIAKKQPSEDETPQKAHSVQLSAEQSLKNFRNIFYEECFGATCIETFNFKSKSSEVASKTQKSAKNLEEFFSIPSEDFLDDVTSIGNDFNTKRDQQSNRDTINTKIDNLNVGFKTAHGKQVSISSKAKQIVGNLLKDLNTDVDIEKDLIDIKTKVQMKNKDLKPKTNYTTNHVDSPEPLLPKPRNMQQSQLNANINKKGFHTSNGREICISTKAKQTVENLLNEFNNDLNIETCEKDLQDLKTKVYNKNKVTRTYPLRLEPNDDIVGQNFTENTDLNNISCKLDEEYAKSSLHEKPLNHMCVNVDVGFQTANGKQVYISAKAKQAVANIFKDINTAVDEEELDDNLAGLGNHKRRISEDNSDIETACKTPAVKIFKHDLRSSKSSLVEQSLKSPLTSASRSVIVRKNLLSLTKKRKNREKALNKPVEKNSEINKDLLHDLNTCTATPTKSYVLIKSKEPAPETPNLREFLSHASLTSTPRIIKNPQSASQTFEDSDLKPIIWKNDSSFCSKSQNNSSYSTKLTECSTSNISFNSPNPSAEERIGRLKMYGKAPDLAPTLIETNHKKCRTSGLRRTRSMHKNPEK